MGEIPAVYSPIFAHVAQEADFEEVFLDATIVRAHQHAAGAPKKKGEQAIGRSRGGRSTKIHALVEGLGLLARFRLTGGQSGDSPQALPLRQDLHPDSVSADKAYDTDRIIEHLATNNIEAVIPPRRNRLVQRPFDKHLYKNRNLVERFFCRIKQFRRIATRLRQTRRTFRFVHRHRLICHLARLNVNTL